jgi:sterol 3beta-glucosyltransferase
MSRKQYTPEFKDGAVRQVTPAPRARRTEKMGIPVLGAFSPLVVPRPADWPDQAQVTGYWLADPDPNWAPPPGLEDFIGAGPPPVSIGFGSMVDDDAARLGAVIRQAPDQAGQRAVLVGGWGGLEAMNNDDRIFSFDQLPYQ